MATPSSKTLIELETKFWQSMIDRDTDAALAMLSEPALMVSSHGAFKFDHAGYRKMAEQGSMLLTEFELSEVDVMFPNEATAVLSYRVKQALSLRENGERIEQEMNDTSTWIQTGQRWQCVMHTETPVESQQAVH